MIIETIIIVFFCFTFLDIHAFSSSVTMCSSVPSYSLYQFFFFFVFFFCFPLLRLLLILHFLHHSYLTVFHFLLNFPLIRPSCFNHHNNQLLCYGTQVHVSLCHLRRYHYMYQLLYYDYQLHMFLFTELWRLL